MALWNGFSDDSDKELFALELSTLMINPWILKELFDNVFQEVRGIL